MFTKRPKSEGNNTTMAGIVDVQILVKPLPMTQRERENNKHLYKTFQKYIQHSKEKKIRIPTHAKIEAIDDLKLAYKLIKEMKPRPSNFFPLAKSALNEVNKLEPQQNIPCRRGNERSLY